MPQFTSPLDNVHIAAPCSADWDQMNGDAQVRHCASCELNVYNLSEVTKREAEKLLIKREGRLSASGFIAALTARLSRKTVRRELLP